MEDFDSTIAEIKNLRKEIPTASKERVEEITMELERVKRYCDKKYQQEFFRDM